MIKKLVFSCVTLFLALTAFAQTQVDSAIAKPSLPLHLFDPEDTIGIIVFELINNYEKFGHFGPLESKQKQTGYVKRFHALFAPEATLPDDVSDTVIKAKEVDIAAYVEMADKRGYLHSSLFIEKEDSIPAYKKDTSQFYYTTIRLFKLYSDKAFIGEQYKYGAYFTLDIKFKTDTAEAYITRIKCIEPDEKFDFVLGKYGRHIYSPILVTNNLDALVQPIPPPYQPKPTRTKSNFFIHGGFQFVDFLGQENYSNNLGPLYTSSNVQQGIIAGINYQKAFGPKDIFGISLGIEYEQNTYGFSQTNAYFEYTESPDGSPLRDKEGGQYDQRNVSLANYTEDGVLTFLKPEIGMFINVFNGPIRLQIYGAFGNAFILESTYSASATNSYTGEIYGYGHPVSEEQLGFYQNIETDFEGELNQVQGFFFYKGGLAVDFMLGKAMAFTLQGEYRSSFTYAIRENNFEYAFFDPDTKEGFDSQLNQLNESRSHKGVAIQAGIKFFLKEKR